MTTLGSTLLGDKEEYISSDSKKKKKNQKEKKGESVLLNALLKSA